MESLKLTLDGISYLKEEHEIDLIDGTELDLKNADSMAALYVAGSKHWKKPPTLAEVKSGLDAFEVFEAVGTMLERFQLGKPKKKAARRR